MEKRLNACFGGISGITQTFAVRSSELLLKQSGILRIGTFHAYRMEQNFFVFKQIYQLLLIVMLLVLQILIDLCIYLQQNRMRIIDMLGTYKKTTHVGCLKTYV